jgi:hypothetical protein
VKSADKVHVNMEKRASVTQVGQGSVNESMKSEVFRKLWKTQCPPKVHHFLWRFAHNSHHLYMNIARRGVEGVELDTRCVVCHKFFEDGVTFSYPASLLNRDGEVECTRTSPSGVNRRCIKTST